MPGENITLELTPAELIAVVAAVKSVVQCSIAGYERTPSAIAVHDKVHELSHAALADTEVSSFLAKLNAAIDAVVPSTPEQDEQARKRWAQLQSVAEARARNAQRPGNFGVSEPSEGN